MNWEYIIIAGIFLIVLYYVWQKVMVPFKKNSGSNCGKGCGCGVDTEELERKKK